MFGGLKRGVYKAISHNRDSGVVRAMQKVSNFIDSAYRNEGSDFDTNGESRNLNRLAQFDFKIALDVGANVGSWSRSAAEAWKNCSVHAFEIAPATAKKFRSSVLESGFRNVHLHEFGMSEKSGSMEMYYFPDNDELTCSSPRHENFESVKFDAKISTVDEFCRDAGISHIDYLKIDVEGDEYKVLRGASNMIAQDRVTCIQFEYGAFSTESRFFIRDYFEMLGDKFHIGKIFPNYVDFSEYSWKMEDFRFCNYLCVSKNREDIKRNLGR